MLRRLAGDFGLARLLLGNMYILNRSGSGTIAYQAPEVCAVRESQCVWGMGWAGARVRACVSVCLCVCLFGFVAARSHVSRHVCASSLQNAQNRGHFLSRNPFCVTLVAWQTRAGVCGGQPADACAGRVCVWHHHVRALLLQEALHRAGQGPHRKAVSWAAAGLRRSLVFLRVEGWLLSWLHE